MTHTVEAARDIFSRTTRDIRAAAEGGPGRLRGAMAQLVAIRDGLRGRERRQVEIYLGLLEEEWEDRPALEPGGGSPGLDEARALVRDALRQRRRDVTRAALDRLAALARAAPGRSERSAIARLAEPVILLQTTLDESEYAGEP